MVNVPKAIPKEFRNDVVAVARRGEAPISRIAKAFGVSGAWLQWRLKIADVEDRIKPGVPQTDAAVLREARNRIRMIERGDRDPMESGGVAVAGITLQMMFPLAHELARGSDPDRGDLSGAGLQQASVLQIAHEPCIGARLGQRSPLLQKNVLNKKRWHSRQELQLGSKEPTTGDAGNDDSDASPRSNSR